MSTETARQIHQALVVAVRAVKNYLQTDKKGFL
jgi:hypothetical protein